MLKIKDGDNKEELSRQMKKELSPSRAIVRIIIGFIAIIIWFLIGINITVLFSSMIQQTLGFTSYFYRNPLIFLLIALLNIILGLVEYFFVGIIWWAAFHLLWSIRWFAGYIKYHKIK